VPILTRLAGLNPASSSKAISQAKAISLRDSARSPWGKSRKITPTDWYFTTVRQQGLHGRDFHPFNNIGEFQLLAHPLAWSLFLARLVLVLVMVLNPGHCHMVNDFSQEHDNDFRPEPRPGLGSRHFRPELLSSYKRFTVTARP